MTVLVRFSLRPEDWLPTEDAGKILFCVKNRKKVFAGNVTENRLFPLDVFDPEFRLNELTHWMLYPLHPDYRSLSPQTMDLE